MKAKIMIIKYLISVLTNLKTIHFSMFFFAKIKASIKLGFLISPLVVLIFEFCHFIKSLIVFQIIEESIKRNFFDHGLIKEMMDWYFGNLSYITIVGFAIIIDHGLGTIKHISIKDFCIKKNLIGLMTKIGLVVACGILFEGLNIIIEKESFVKDYLTIVTRLIVFLYPAGSAFGNSAFISNGKFPPQSWLNKLKSFQKNLDPKEFNEKNEEKKQHEFTD